MSPKLSIEQMNELFYLAGYKPPIQTREMQVPYDIPEWAIVLFGCLYLRSKNNYDTAILEFDRLLKDRNFNTDLPSSGIALDNTKPLLQDDCSGSLADKPRQFISETTAISELEKIFS